MGASVTYRLADGGEYQGSVSAGLNRVVDFLPTLEERLERRVLGWTVRWKRVQQLDDHEQFLVHRPRNRGSA